jgi:predicted nucleic acid-binding protein
VTAQATGDIHLDTSFLIRALVTGSTEADGLRSWLRSGRAVAISTLAWGEFLCGPLEAGVEELARRIVHQHVALGTDQAVAAAQLFRDTGRRRGSFQDCLIAATALIAGAELATSDRRDFERFTDAGLELTE